MGGWELRVAPSRNAANRIVFNDFTRPDILPGFGGNSQRLFAGFCFCCTKGNYKVSQRLEFEVTPRLTAPQRKALQPFGYCRSIDIDLTFFFLMALDSFSIY